MRIRHLALIVGFVLTGTGGQAASPPGPGSAGNSSTNPIYAQTVNGAGVVSAGNPQAVALPDLGSAAFSVTSSTTIPATGPIDLGAGSSGVLIEFTSTGSGNTVQFQASNDPNTGYQTVTCLRDDNVPVTGMAGVNKYQCPAIARYFRLNVSTYSSGTIAGTLTARAVSSPLNPVQLVTQYPPAAGSVYSPSRYASSSAEGSLVIKSSAGNLFGVSVVSGASAGYLLTFNATSAPSDGAVTPADCIPVAANSQTSLPLPIYGDYYSTGITLVFSTSGCFTKAVSNTAFFRVLYK